MQFVEDYWWVQSYGISYKLGIDGISLLLIVLTGFLTPLALLGSWESVHKKVKTFSFFMLALESAMIGVFVSLKVRGNLRGCIGTFEPCERDIANEVIRNAISSAMCDPIRSRSMWSATS
jgi:hypothetical protein